MDTEEYAHVEGEAETVTTPSDAPRFVPTSSWSSQNVLREHIPEYSSIATPPHAPSRNVRTREFDGQSSWRNYKSQFDRVAALNRWDAEKIDYLWISLAGTALNFAEGLPETQKADYEALCHALDQRFGAERLAAVHNQSYSQGSEPQESQWQRWDKTSADW